MRISDLLGKFNLFAVAPKQPELDQEFVGEIQNRPELEQVAPETEDKTESKTMVAPLQQKLELLKRAVGVENIYDIHEEDELDHILKIAGVPTATIFDAGDDEPLDS